MIRLWPGLAMAAALLAALPAAAEPHYVISSADKIDLVRDLPNDETFERDGQYYDLGYLYSTDRVNGVDVPRQGGGFVLYHDDRYAKLGPSELDEIAGVLGEDPTEGYNPPVAQAPRGGDARQAGWGPDAAASPLPVAPSSASSARRASKDIGIGGVLVVLLVLTIRVRVLREIVFGGLLRLAFYRRRTAANPVPTSHGDPFEHRIAQRLAELEAAPDRGQSVPPVPAPRTFGRKLA